MYEHITYEDILQRMLDKVPSIIDKREGSIIYDALAPCAIELQLMYIELDVILSETFGDSASREYLIRRATERGLTPTDATYAILKGVFNKDIEIGARFSCGDLNYITVEKIADKEYKVQCEVLGIVGNKNFGDLIPIDYIDGLTSAQLIELLIPGEEEEDTEEFRNRYFESFDVKAYGGNVADYREKTNGIAGVGSTKVTPIWDGGGTVLLTILDSEYNQASDTLISIVQEELDPTMDGNGIGVAPIGHIVTVNTAMEIEINVSTAISFQEGYSFNEQKQKIEDVIGAYFLELRQSWATQSAIVIRISQLETRVMDVEGVVDISNTKLNSTVSNLVLTQYEIPTMGGVTNG